MSSKGRFPKLSSAVKHLVQMGVYSLYSIQDQNWFLLCEPKKHRCCDGIEAPERYQKIDEEGKILSELPSPHNQKVSGVVFLTDEDVGQDSTYTPRPKITLRGNLS